jgi:hypothetical protein
MPKSIGETIDALFRGVVFVVYDYFFSLGRLAIKPIAGCLQLVRRNRAVHKNQIGPYVFLFLNAFLALSVPKYLSRIVNIYTDEFPYSSQKNTSIEQAYSEGLAVFEPKTLLAICLSSVLLCAIVDGSTSVLSNHYGQSASRRRLLKSSLLYLL